MSGISENVNKRVKEACDSCSHRKEGTCMWGGFVGDCPKLPALNKPADAEIQRDSELQPTTYQIQKYTTTEFVVGAKTGRACDIIARFNNEDAANEYCNLKAMIDRQAKEIALLQAEISLCPSCKRQDRKAT